MKRAAILLGLSPLLLAQSQPRLVPDISARSIEIRYSFTGAQLLLFGASSIRVAAYRATPPMSSSC